MTLPNSGPISTAMIRAELGGVGPVVIPSPEVRDLVGIPNGPIVLPNDFWGKSSVPDFFVGNPSPSFLQGFGQSGQVVQTSTPNGGVTVVNVTGGSGNFSYVWELISSDGFGPSATNPTSLATAFTDFDAGFGGTTSQTWRLAVTDEATNVTKFSGNVSASINFN